MSAPGHLVKRCDCDTLRGDYNRGVAGRGQNVGAGGIRVALRHVLRCAAYYGLGYLRIGHMERAPATRKESSRIL